jgi:hypothetical protein
MVSFFFISVYITGQPKLLYSQLTIYSRSQVIYFEIYKLIMLNYVEFVMVIEKGCYTTLCSDEKQNIACCPKRV